MHYLYIEEKKLPKAVFYTGLVISYDRFFNIVRLDKNHILLSGSHQAAAHVKLLWLVVRVIIKYNLESHFTWACDVAVLHASVKKPLINCCKSNINIWF